MSLNSGRYLLRMGSVTNSLSSVQYRYSSAKINRIINFVPQQEAWVIERMGKFHSVLKPGVNVLIPVLDSIKYVQSLKEIAIEIPQQGAITLDNVQLHLDGVLYLRVVDPYKASYGVEDAEFAISQLAQTTMRSEVGKINLDTVFKEREQLNINIVEAINKAAEAWGMVCMRYEIRTMTMPARVQEAMQMQVEAERKKRAAILESEGKRESAINVAEGAKQSRILASEASMQEKINEARGVSEAMERQAEAKKNALEKVSHSLNKHGGHSAAALIVAEQYIKAFSNLAKDTNTVIIPSNASDVTSMVATAMSVYKKLATDKPGTQILEEFEPMPEKPSHKK